MTGLPSSAGARRGRALCALLLLGLYLLGPVVHVLQHVHDDAQADCAAATPGCVLHPKHPAHTHHASDCPLCQSLLNAAPLLSATAGPTLSAGTTPAAALPAAPSRPRTAPSVCWSSSRGPPCA